VADAAQAFLEREYSNPTRAWVTGALQGGIDDPRLMVGETWTPEQQRRWSAQFSALANLIKAEESQRAAAAGASASRGAILRDTSLPLVRDVREGAVQGAGDLAGMALRGVDAVGEGGFADTLNRGLESREQDYANATSSGPVMGSAQTVVRGASRSITTAAALAPLGPRGIIAGFAASLANKAIT
jgi:hypothetical protein